MFKNSRFVFFSLATQPNSNQSLTQWRPECRNRRRNSRLCRWNTFCIGSLCGCFKGFIDLRRFQSVKVKFNKKWRDIYNYLFLQRNLDLVESKMSLNCGGSLLGARYKVFDTRLAMGKRHLVPWSIFRFPPGALRVWPWEEAWVRETVREVMKAVQVKYFDQHNSFNSN